MGSGFVSFLLKQGKVLIPFSGCWPEFQGVNVLVLRRPSPGQGSALSALCARETGREPLSLVHDVLTG